VYGFNNNDNYLYNDTTKLTIVNTGIFDQVANPDNKVRIIPNPFKQSFNLELESKINEYIEITLIGQSGKILWKEQRSLLPGLNIFTITPEELRTGFYTVRITGKATFKTARVVKIE
jgi:hypothetical protein